MKKLILVLVAMLGTGCIPEGTGRDDRDAALTWRYPQDPDPEEGLVAIEIRMRPEVDLVVGLTREFQALGWYEDGEHRIITKHATWESSNPDSIAFDIPEYPYIANVYMRTAEPVAITATVGEVVGERFFPPLHRDGQPSAIPYTY